MKYYKLRVDTVNVEDTYIVDIIQQYSTVYMYCLEGYPDNPHLHFYFETDTGSAMIRTRLRSLGLQGNASYSLKEVDEQYPIEYLAYMMKGNDWYQSGLPEEQITLAKEYNNKVKLEIKEKKKNRKTQLELVDEYVKENMKYWVQKDHYTLLPITSLVIQYYKEKGILFREFQIISIIQTIYLKYNKDAQERMVEKLIRKITEI